MNKEFKFDKTQPLCDVNFPKYSFAYYTVYGYKRDAAGIRHPISWQTTLPMGSTTSIPHPDNVIITGCERSIGGPRII